MNQPKAVRRSVHRSIAILLPWILLVGAGGSAQGQASPVADLVRDLQSREVDVRREAAYGLAQLGPEAEEAVPALIKAVRDQDAQVWAQSTEALARIGPAAAEGAIPVLLANLDQRDRQRWYRAQSPESPDRRSKHSARSVPRPSPRPPNWPNSGNIRMRRSGWP